MNLRNAPHLSGRSYLIIFAAILSILGSDVRQLHAQSLVEMYRSARFRSQAERLLAQHGREAVPIPPDRVPHIDDSLRARMARLFPEEPPPEPPLPEPLFEIRKWNLIPKLGRSWFEKEFSQTSWSFLGSNTLATLDTIYTRELRARLEAEFGPPTQTVADLDLSQGLAVGQNIQFEYWFVLNDTIPLKVMDVNGPFERGVVIASAQQYRAMLPDLKEAFLGRWLTDAPRATYVDYYYLPEQRMWFLSGYNGLRFFLERIPRPDLKVGRPLMSNVPR